MAKRPQPGMKKSESRGRRPEGVSEQTERREEDYREVEEGARKILREVGVRSKTNSNAERRWGRRRDPRKELRPQTRAAEKKATRRQDRKRK